MHLAYLDDSDTKKKSLKLQVVSGVIIEDKSFKILEISMRSIRSELVPLEKLEEFKEFHACELYGGHGVFAGIPQEKRFDAIRSLLQLLEMEEGLPVVYGAVDIAKGKREIYGSADPLDVAFRICMKEVYEWVRQRSVRFDLEKDEDAALQAWFEELVILIVDDCDPKQRNMLQSSFRNLRHPVQLSPDAPLMERLPHFHDDMFFGDSRFSIGIQLADLCSYFIARYLDGDTEIAPFYDMIEPHIVYGQLYPADQTFSKPTPRLKWLEGLGGVLGGIQNEEQRGILELQSSNEENPDGLEAGDSAQDRG